LDGNGSLVLGIMILLFSIWMHRNYKTLKRKRDAAKEQEKNEILLRKNVLPYTKH
jgi:hypothetical protein